MEKIRILHLIDSEVIYGAEMMLVNLIKEQIESGMEPVLGSFRRDREEPRAIERRVAALNAEVKVFPSSKGVNIV